MPMAAKRGCGNPALRRDRVAARREDLGDAGGLEARGTHAEGGAQPRAAGADHHHVIGVVDDAVGPARRAGRRLGDRVHRLWIPCGPPQIAIRRTARAEAKANSPHMVFTARIAPIRAHSWLI